MIETKTNRINHCSPMQTENPNPAGGGGGGGVNGYCWKHGLPSFRNYPVIRGLGFLDLRLMIDYFSYLLFNKIVLYP